jgi:2,5-diketo-D-gluconate reductase A
MPDAVPTIALNNGTAIPQLGFGVFQIKPDETADAVQRAIEIGYRHIDTAQMYRNEHGVGEGIRASGVDPSEIWVTSKISNGAHGYDKTLRSFDGTLEALGTQTVDLMLIHWPLPTVGDFVSTWKGLEKLYADGRVRSIGVSNFQTHHLDKLFDETDVVPVVNQIEVHPYFAQNALLAYNSKYDIATEAWSPIAQGRVLGDPVIGEIAARHGKSPAQAVLRWHIQRDSIVFPKSNHPNRMRENFEIFDFELSEEEMSRISDLDRNHRDGADPDTMAYVPR